jgi:hypothetical protein
MRNGLNFQGKGKNFMLNSYQLGSKLKLLIIFILLVSVGCQRGNPDYELISNGGTLYRLNKRTGKIDMIFGKEIIPLEDRTREIQKMISSISERSKTWPEETLPVAGGLKINLKTRWKDNYLYFIFSVSPYKNLREAYRANLSSQGFTLRFYDAEGFQIFEIEVKLSDMSRIVDEKGEPIYLEINSRVPCNVETYFAMEAWTCSWRLNL